MMCPYIAKGETDGNLNNNHPFLMKIINYSVPVFKYSSQADGVIDESQYSFKNILLGVIGIDTRNPLSILGKELSYIKTENISSDEEANNAEYVSNPFKLNEGEVLRNSSENPDQTRTAENNSTEDLPDKKVNVYDPKLKKSVMSTKPEVFIYHTHTSESYISNVSEVAQVLKDKLDVNSDIQTRNVCAVGDALAEELEKNYNISVVHDKTVHDAYAYTQSYERSGKTVDKYLKQYGDFKLIIDLHRDSIESRKNETIKMNGETAAKIMFVMTKKNPHFSKNIAVANKLTLIANKLFPGFCKGINTDYNYGTNYFNQAKSNNAVLMEVGSHINTTDEAKASAKYMARVIAEYINGKN